MDITGTHFLKTKKFLIVTVWSFLHLLIDSHARYPTNCSLPEAAQILEAVIFPRP